MCGRWKTRWWSWRKFCRRKFRKIGRLRTSGGNTISPVVTSKNKKLTLAPKKAKWVSRPNILRRKLRRWVVRSGIWSRLRTTRSWFTAIIPNQLWGRSPDDGYFKVVLTCRSFIQPCEVKIKDTINPYKAKASPKIKIKIIPTKILSCWAFALTPASPTIPIARPAARELNPQQRPEAKWAYAALEV